MSTSTHQAIKPTVFQPALPSEVLYTTDPCNGRAGKGVNGPQIPVNGPTPDPSHHITSRKVSTDH